MILLIIFTAVTIASLLWVKGIDNMDKDHPDYKGEDLFEDENKK
jgi:hypothetical protein